MKYYWFDSYLACWYIISKHRSSSIWVTIHFVYKNWCPLNNFWKTASIRFIFGMLIYNIKTQVKFDLGNNPLILTELWAFFKVIAHLAGTSVSYGHISSFYKCLFSRFAIKIVLYKWNCVAYGKHILNELYLMVN